MHVNDLKHAAFLLDLGVVSGHIDDLENDWLELWGYSVGTINEKSSLVSFWLKR